MNFHPQNWRISRRHALRGLGALVALPALDCMTPSGRAAGGPPDEANADSPRGERPRRSVSVYLPNGVNTLDYQILEAGEGYKFSRTLAPLEKHRAHLTPISGLHHPHGLGNHHNCQTIWLTGAEIGPTARNSVSVDQLIAEHTAPHTRFRSLELSCTGQSLSYDRDGVRQPSDRKPGDVFKRLFEAPKDGIAAERRALRRRGSVVDAVLGEARELERKIGAEDRARLDQYLGAVREVEVRVERSDAWLDVPRPDVDALSPGARKRIDKAVSQQDPGDYYRTMYDLIVLAFQTDAARVVTFMTGDESHGFSIPELSINQSRHQLSHHNGDPAALARLSDSDRFNVAQFSYFLDRLAATSDAHGPLLDSTVALYGSGMAYGHSHGNANLPTVVAGGAALGLKHGRHLDYNKVAGQQNGERSGDGTAFDYAVGEDGALTTKHYQTCSRPVNSRAVVSDLLLTIARAAGVNADRFADSGGVMTDLLA